MTMTAKKLRRQVAERLFGAVGCTDHNCVFGSHGGMGTNGGCGCLKDSNPIQLRRVIMQLRDVGQVLAAIAPVVEVER
jgi:hypothetical protein